MMRLLILALLFAAPTAHAEALLQAGHYLCTAEERAGVGTNHTEGAPPPSAFSEHVQYHFRIAVTRSGADYHVVEVPYDGPARSES